jgi:hypothetical protein
MAVEDKQAKAVIVKTLVEAYGVAVRSGLITPCLQDENDFRKMFGLQKAPEVVEAAWRETGGVRSPITLQKGLPSAVSSGNSVSVDDAVDGEGDVDAT